MATDIAALEAAPLPPDFDNDDEVGTEMYFRAPNGDILFARINTVDNSEKNKLVAAGYKPLEAYGAFKVQPYHMDHPFEVLFIRGGAKELSLKQIIEQGLHFRPILLPRCGLTWGEKGHIRQGRRNRKMLRHTPECWEGAQPVVFPQLEGQTIEGPFECKWCSEDDGGGRKFPTAKGLRQHESVMHPDEIGSDRLGAQLIQGLSGGRASTTELDLMGEIQKMREEMEALKGGNPHVDHPFTPAATPYVCGLCGDALPNAFTLNKHISDHKKEPAVA